MNFRFLKIIKSPTDKLLAILNNNVIGTPGSSMLYQHLGVHNKIHRIANPYFVNLVRNEKIIGTCCFCGRTTINRGKEIQAFYARYFSLENMYRRSTVLEKTLNRKSELRKEIESVLKGEALGVNGESFFHYAYVDPRNVRSVLLCSEFGFETVRQYTTIIFSRLNPKPDRNYEVIETESINEEMHQHLKEFYKGYNTFSFENLSDRKYYFIKDQHGKLIAGAQVNPDLWKILSLPGVTGKIILNTFSYLPFFNRIFSTTYKFLTLEGIYYAQGNERLLEKLFEALLFKYKVNSAIIVVDPRTRLYSVLRSLRLGLMDKLNKEVRGNVICRFNNFTPEEKQAFINNPVYISGIDVT